MQQELLRTAFPFHIALNERLEVVGWGPTLDKLGLGVRHGVPLQEVFRIKTPPLPCELSAILEQQGTVFFLEDHRGRITLRGQMAPANGSGVAALLFLCSPVLADLDEAGRLGLTFKDFALHDSTIDHLILMQTQATVLNDTRKMAKQLLQESRERREAQKALRSTNLRLEETVRERTEELLVTNAQLERTLERQRLRNRELAQLNAIGERLHGCQTVKDAFPIIRESVMELFPQSSGRLACYKEGSGSFEVSIDWGAEHPNPGRIFHSKTCKALREKRTVTWDDRGGGENCPYAHAQPNESGLCRPLKVGDQVLGLLHFRFPLPPADDPANEEAEANRQSRRMLGATMSEHVSLALANLRMKERLEGQAIRDSLTGLYNRRFMESSLEQEMERAQRSGDSIGVILLDVDHFKRFNDTHGHQAGDAVLIQLAALLNTHIRKGDIACRYGGEEFLVILSGATLQKTSARAEQIRAAVENCLCVTHDGGCLGAVTISAGVAVYPRDGANAGTLLRAADETLYKAKSQGRNCVVVAGGL